MAQYIRFTKTTKKDVTVGKFYEVKNLDTGNGYYFDDDAGDQRYVRRRGKLNYFEVFNEADFPVSDVSDDELDDAVSAIEQVQKPEDKQKVWVRFTDPNAVSEEMLRGKWYEASNVVMAGDRPVGGEICNELGDTERHVHFWRTSAIEPEGPLEVFEGSEPPEDDAEPTLHIVFSETTKKDVTVGKFYEVKHVGGGFTFLDDVGDLRYVSEDSSDSEFEVVDTSRDHPVETSLPQVEPAELPDGVVCIDFIDGYVAHFHDVDVFNIEERVGITLVVITDVEGGKTLIPFDRVRKVRLLHLTDGGNE